jgi:tripartite-type tricarboxylate transporter receptor subunit TctC
MDERTTGGVMNKLRMVTRSGWAALLMTAAGAGWAQNYPDKPIRLMGPLPGGGGDLVMRQIAPFLRESLGQPIVIDNRPGNVLGEVGSKTPPDGYTLIIVGTSFMIGHLLRTTTWDPERDFVPVTLADAGPNVLVVHPSVPVKTVKELIALAKARPGQLNYSSGPPGSSLHLGGELFKQLAGVNITWVPYKGGGQAAAAVLAGESEVVFAEAAASAAHIKSGRMRALAVTSAQPSPLFPGMPTVASAGLPGYELVGIDGIVAPAKTPQAIVNRLNQEIVRALNQTVVRETLFNTGVVVVAGSPEEFGRFMRSEIVKWGKVIKEANIRLD